MNITALKKTALHELKNYGIRFIVDILAQCILLPIFVIAGWSVFGSYIQNEYPINVQHYGYIGWGIVYAFSGAVILSACYYIFSIPFTLTMKAKLSMASDQEKPKIIRLLWLSGYTYHIDITHSATGADVQRGFHPLRTVGLYLRFYGVLSVFAFIGVLFAQGAYSWNGVVGIFRLIPVAGIIIMHNII